MYHANNGLYFERQPSGTVIVATPERSWTLTPAEWASVVASVSAEGEDGDTFKAALAFHAGDHEDDDE